MKIVKLMLIGLAILAVLAGCTRVKEAAYVRGVQFFLENNLEEAEKLLQASVTLMPDNPDAFAWYAECLRRLNRHDQAAGFAYDALKLDPQHAFAHTVLADLFNPQYSSWSRVDFDSTWYHLREAVRYDPMDGNAWSPLWVESMRRGDVETETKAAAMMLDSGFFTEPLLAYNRWHLEYLPENAILLTNGDMDTYPVASLQAVEGLRRDVVMVNLSLLNLPWYIDLVADRNGIPLPAELGDVGLLRASTDEAGNLLKVNTQVVRGWMRLQADGKLGRPLCAALTVADLDFSPDARDRMVLRGPYYEIMLSPVEAHEDPAGIAECLQEIDPVAFEGPFASDGDRSPVRRVHTDKLATNITNVMLRHAALLAEAGNLEDAAAVLARAEAFDARIAASGCCEAFMDSLRLRIGATPAGTP
jgi:tetratricopeptide (TPR) repeat protein